MSLNLILRKICRYIVKEFDLPLEREIFSP